MGWPRRVRHCRHVDRCGDRRPAARRDPALGLVRPRHGATRVQRQPSHAGRGDVGDDDVRPSAGAHADRPSGVAATVLPPGPATVAHAARPAPGGGDAVRAGVDDAGRQGRQRAARWRVAERSAVGVRCRPRQRRARHPRPAGQPARRRWDSRGCLDRRPGRVRTRGRRRLPPRRRRPALTGQRRRDH